MIHTDPDIAQLGRVNRDPQGTVAPNSYAAGTLGRIEAVQLGNTAGYVARIRELEQTLAAAIARFEVIENGGNLGAYGVKRFIETLRNVISGAPK